MMENITEQLCLASEIRYKGRKSKAVPFGSGIDDRPLIYFNSDGPVMAGSRGGWVPFDEEMTMNIFDVDAIIHINGPPRTVEFINKKPTKVKVMIKKVGKPNGGSESKIEYEYDSN